MTDAFLNSEKVAEAQCVARESSRRLLITVNSPNHSKPNHRVDSLLVRSVLVPLLYVISPYVSQRTNERF